MFLWIKLLVVSGTQCTTILFSRFLWLSKFQTHLKEANEDAFLETLNTLNATQDATWTLNSVGKRKLLSHKPGGRMSEGCKLIVLIDYRPFRIYVKIQCPNTGSAIIIIIKHSRVTRYCRSMQETINSKVTKESTVSRQRCCEYCWHVRATSGERVLHLWYII